MSDLEVSAAREAVWSLVSDPTTYPDWLVWIKQIERRDGGWPAAGSSFCYIFSWGPFKLHGDAVVIAAAKPGHLRLRWRRRIVGWSIADFVLESTSDRTRVHLHDAPGGLFAALALNPLTAALATAQDSASLGRLGRLVRDAGATSARNNRDA